MSNQADAVSLTFGKARRLTRPAEFLQVKTEGRAQRGSLLILGVIDAADGARFRSGVVTSKRVGAAAVRNRVRRRIREIVRRHQHEIRPGCWIVSIARPAAAGVSYAALEDEWLRLAKRAFILAPSCS